MSEERIPERIGRLAASFSPEEFRVEFDGTYTNKRLVDPFGPDFDFDAYMAHKRKRIRWRCHGWSKQMRFNRRPAHRGAARLLVSPTSLRGGALPFGKPQRGLLQELLRWPR